MTPIGKDNIDKIVTSSTVTWGGQPIPSLCIKTGDTLTEVSYQLAIAIVQLQKSIDLTGLNLSCITNCTTCSDKSLKNVLQILINRFCSALCCTGTTTELNTWPQ